MGWGLGPVASRKQMLVKSGELGKFGKIQENTPESWKKFYEDYNAGKIKAEPGIVVKVVRGEAGGDQLVSRAAPETEESAKKAKKSEDRATRRTGTGDRVSATV